MIKSWTYVLLLNFFCWSLYAKEVHLTRNDHRNGIFYELSASANIDENSPQFIKYRQHQKIFNLFVRYPNSLLKNKAIREDGKIEYLKTYTTNHLGLRKTPSNPKASKNLIIAGDSNIFGMGCNDNETLTTKLSEKLPEHQIINLGIAGSSGNTLLYFLQHFNINEIIPDKTKPGMMIYDFSEYLIERMIGSKNFMRWGFTQPAFEINSNNELEFLGSFDSLWISKFYRLIALIDYKNYLFPNLPRIHQHHLKLIARIFLEIKNEYLKQTNINNRFAVMINPFFGPSSNAFIEELQKVNIETINFLAKEKLPRDRYPLDLHLTPKGQEYYSEMIAKKILSKDY